MLPLLLPRPPDGEERRRERMASGIAARLRAHQCWTKAAKSMRPGEGRDGSVRRGIEKEVMGGWGLKSK